MRFFLFLFCFFLAFACWSQTIVVVDNEDSSPLEFVSITGLNNNKVVSTNAEGKANIESLKTNKTVLVHLLGYQPKTIEYDFLKEETRTIRLELASFNLNKVIISATRWQQSENIMPHKISSLDAKDISFQNPQTSADLLENSGEVFIQKSQQGGGSPMIRGFATNRLLYSFDGVRMNTAIFRSGNIQNVISIDPFTMESVEVFFGPGSILYGSDAIGGVMSFSSKTPKLSSSSKPLIKGNSSLRFSTANSEITSHLDLSIGLKKWGFLSSYSRSDFGDLTMGKNGPNDFLRESLVVRQNNEDIVVKNTEPRIQTPTNYRQDNFMQKVLFQPEEELTFIYAFHFSETSSFDRYDRLTQRNGNDFRYAENRYGPQRWMMHQLSANYSKPTGLFDKVKTSIAYQLFEESRIDRIFRNDVQRNRKEAVDAVSFNLDFTKSIKEKHQLFYGFESVFNKVESIGSSNNILTQEKSEIQSRYPDSKWYSNAFYISDLYEFSPKLTFKAGLRFNHYALVSTFDTSFVRLPFNKIDLDNLAINGSLGLVYRPQDSWVLSSNFSTGFRSPNVDDIGKFFDSEPNTVVVPNSKLSAEYSYNLEIGITKIFSKTIKVDVTGFYTILDDALVRRNFSLNGSDSLFFDGENKRVQAIQNAAIATVYGLQSGIEIKLNSSIHWVNRINFQKGEEELDNGETSASRHAAPLFGTSKINYKKGDFSLQFSIQYSDEVAFKNLNVGERAKEYLYASDSDGNPFSPSWYTFNMMSQYSFNKNISAQIGLENITDQRYRTYSSGIASAGRNFIFALTAKF